MSENDRAALRTVGIIYREHSDDAAALGRRLLDVLLATGRAAWYAHREEEGLIHERLAGTDLMLVLGGDGTILSVARLCAPLHVPILGVNFGRVGFLTDIVLVRGGEPRVVRLKVWIDGHHYNTTVADGIIISTATGSTAYNLSAGGPILHPQVRSSVLTPLAPHLAADRSLILEPNAVITVELEPNSAPAILSADGQLNVDIPIGTQVTVRSNAHATKFLRRRPPTHFYRILSAKLRDNL